LLTSTRIMMSLSATYRLRATINAIDNAASYYILPFIYTLGSLYLYVESVRQLWYLPPNAYVVASWSYYFPHPF